MSKIIISVLLMLSLTNVNAQWQNAGPIGTGNCILSLNNKILVGANDGLYVTDNNGNTWSKILGNMLGEVVTCLYLASNSSIFAGTQSGIYISTDNGINWTSVYLTTPPSNIGCIVGDGVNIFAGGYNTGVIHSSNSGINWNPTSSSVTGNTIKSLTISGNTIFAGTGGNGICISQDNGVTWSISNNGLGAISSVSSLASDNGKIYAVMGSIYISQNNGLSWNSLNVTSTPSAIAAINNKLFIATISGVYISSNYGSNWTLSNSGIEFNTVSKAFCVIDSNHIYFLGKGLYYSDNIGSNWIRINTAGIFSNEYVNVLKVHESDIFAGTGIGLWKSSDSGLQWDFIPLGISNYSVQSIAIQDSFIFIGTGNGKILFSNDYGISWLLTADLPTPGGLDISQIEYFGGSVYACNLYGVYHSTNNGNSWISYNSGLPGSPNINTTSLLISGSNMYLGTFTSGIYRRNIFSGNWVSINNTLPTNVRIMTITSIDTTIFVGTFDDGIYRSTDNGDNWIGINNGINNYTIRDLSTNDSILLASADEEGMYISYDKGGNWLNINNGLPVNTDVYAIEILNTEIFAGLPNRGIWKRNLNNLTLNLRIVELPYSIIYPNPFLLTTTFQSTTYLKNANAIIYNTIGQEIKHIKNISGTTFIIEKDNIPAGLYFINVEEGNKIITTEKFVISDY